MKDGPSSLALNRKVPDHIISFFFDNQYNSFSMYVFRINM